MIKFANYFLSRKHTQSLKDLTALLTVITTLTTNKVGLSVIPFRMVYLILFEMMLWLAYDEISEVICLPSSQE